MTTAPLKACPAVAVRLYRDDHLSGHAIAIKLNVNRNAVYKWLRIYHVPIRPEAGGGSRRQPAEHMGRIIEYVTRRTGIKRADIMSSSRVPAHVAARHLAMWIAARRFGYSTPAIGLAINRDHSSVVYGIAKVERAGGDPVSEKIREDLNV